MAMRPEVELLLYCARTRMDSERAERIRALLQQDMDWAYLLRTALRHGVMPLMYWHLNVIYPDAVPSITLDHLRDHFHTNTWRNLFLTGELLTLLQCFETHGIPTIPYKGPTLAAAAYGNLALREFDDLDLLVHQRDVSKAKNLLLDLGYRPRLQLTGAQEHAFLQSQYEYGFEHPGSGVHVEIKWALVSRYFSFPLDPESLWERLQPASLGGVTVMTLAPEDLLVILAVHGAWHRWSRLDFICDVAEFIGVQKGMAWNEVMAMEQVGTLGGERMLCLSLFLASEFLGAPLLQEVLHRVQTDPMVNTLARQVFDRLFRDAHHPPGVLEQSLFHPFDLRMRERLRDRIRYCVRIATTPLPADWELLHLPESLFWLYPVFRMIRLGGKYGSKLFEFLRERCDLSLDERSGHQPGGAPDSSRLASSERG